MENSYMVEVRMTMFVKAESRDKAEQEVIDELEKYGWVNACSAELIDK